MVSAQMTSKGQLTVPVKIRNELHLEPGSRVEFVKTADGSYAIRPADGSVRSLKGTVQAPAKAVTLDDMDAAIASAVSDRTIHHRLSEPSMSDSAYS